MTNSVDTQRLTLKLADLLSDILARKNAAIDQPLADILARDSAALDDILTRHSEDSNTGEKQAGRP